MYWGLVLFIVNYLARPEKGQNNSWRGNCRVGRLSNHGRWVD